MMLHEALGLCHVIPLMMRLLDDDYGVALCGDVAWIGKHIAASIVRDSRHLLEPL
jgi:hypothetical protein